MRNSIILWLNYNFTKIYNYIISLLRQTEAEAVV